MKIEFLHIIMFLVTRRQEEDEEGSEDREEGWQHGHPQEHDEHDEKQGDDETLQVFLHFQQNLTSKLYIALAMSREKRYLKEMLGKLVKINLPLQNS